MLFCDCSALAAARHACAGLCGACYAAVLRCCTALLHVGRGLERRFQPCTKLFAKVAVQIVAVNLILAFVGVFCAMRVSRGVVAVCMWMYVTDTIDGVLCCPFMYALPREIFLSNRWMLPETPLAPLGPKPLGTRCS